MNECLDSLGTKAFFSTLDCNWGYWKSPSPQATGRRLHLCGTPELTSLQKALWAVKCTRDIPEDPIHPLGRLHMSIMTSLPASCYSFLQLNRRTRPPLKTGIGSPLGSRIFTKIAEVQLLLQYCRISWLRDKPRKNNRRHRKHGAQYKASNTPRHSHNFARY